MLDPIGQLNLYVILATMVITTLLYFALRRWLFTPYIAVLDERQTRLDAGRERLAQAEEIRQQAVWDVASIQADARAKAEVVEHEALEASEAYRKRTMDEAIRDVDGLLAQGRAEIAEARGHETERVRSEAITCVTVACNRLLGQGDPLIVESAVDRAIDRLG